MTHTHTHTGPNPDQNPRRGGGRGGTTFFYKQRRGVVFNSIVFRSNILRAMPLCKSVCLVTLIFAFFIRNKTKY